MKSTVMSKCLLGGIVTMLACIAMPAPSRAASGYAANGDAGSPPAWVRRTIDGNGSIAQVDQPSLDGGQSWRFTVPDDGASYRAELATAPTGWGSYDYRFAVYLPPDWRPDQQASIVAQWHGTKLANHRDTNPPISLAVQGDHWRLMINHLATPTRVQKKEFPLPPIQTGVWNRFDVHIAWSHDGQDGVVTLTHDGQTWVDYTGPNNYDQKHPPYFKIGIYHPQWNPRKQIPHAAGGAPIVVYTAGVTVAPGSR